MKKALVFFGTGIIFAILGHILDNALGITFPSDIGAFVHRIFYIMYGYVLGIVWFTKILPL